MKLRILLLIVLFVFGCKPSRADGPDRTILLYNEFNLGSIYRFEDSEKDVTCWLFQGGAQSAGISCLPNSDLPYKGE